MSSDNVKNVDHRPLSDLRAAETEQMGKYGISCVPENFFYYREFRYSNLEDAIAQAKRDQHHSMFGTREERLGGI